MLQKADKNRLDKVLEIIENEGIRFPVAEISRKLNKDKGMVSAYLAGKKPISNNFYSSFLAEYAPQKRTILIDEADVGRELSNLFELVIKQQAAINILMNAFGEISAKAVGKEYERLFDEYVKKQ